jgi:hypothetical protein
MAIVPAYSHYGEPATRSSLAHVAGSRLASASAPYVGRGNKCSANDDTCEGMRAKGTELCMGHLRASSKNPKAVTSDAPAENDED